MSILLTPIVPIMQLAFDMGEEAFGKISSFGRNPRRGLVKKTKSHLLPTSFLRYTYPSL